VRTPAARPADNGDASARLVSRQSRPSSREDRGIAPRPVSHVQSMREVTVHGGDGEAQRDALLFDPARAVPGGPDEPVVQLCFRRLRHLTIT